MEEWRAIPGFDAYEVSCKGRVRRSKRGRTSLAGRVLKPWTEDNGYLRVSLRRDGRSVKMWVQRAVALAFHGDPPTPAHEAAHFDGNKQNNVRDNIRWATPIENASDTLRLGRHVRGEAHWNAVLTDEQREQLRATRNDGPGFYIRLAKRFGISQPHAWGLYNGRSRRTPRNGDTA